MRYRNAMQRDPNLAKAFDNLAGLFAPPSGSDYLASAKMQSERADAERRAMIFSHQDPAVAAELAARMGIANYGQTQSGFGKTDATNRRGQDISAKTELQKTELQQAGELQRLYATPRVVNKDQALLVPDQTQAATGFGPTMMGIQERDPGKTYVLPPGAQEGATVMGPPKPMTVDELNAQVAQGLMNSGVITPQQYFNTSRNVTTIVDDEGRIRSSTEAAINNPKALPATPDVATFVAPGPDGKPMPFNGRVDPNGRIINTDTGQVVPNAIKYERSSGTSLEVNKDGTISFRQGNVGGQTNSRQTDLSRASDDNTRTSNEMVSLIRMIRPDDIGVAGNLNKLLTNYGSQLFPGLARPDVIARVTQLEASILGSARALAQDDRLSDGDRKAVERIAGSTGVGESFEGVQAKLATLAVMTAYRAAFADGLREGQRLPNLNPTTLGRLVDQGRIPADVALMYQQNALSGGGVTGGPVPGVQVPPGLPGAPGAPQAAAPAAQGDPLAEARAAIARGAPRDAVIQRLQGLGVNPEGL